MIKYLLFGGIVTASFSCSPDKKDNSGRDEVYLCESITAYSYHLTTDCPGLKKCRHTITKTTREIAMKQGRTFCGWEINDSIKAQGSDIEEN